MFNLFGPKTYESFVQAYALADGSFAYQGRCDCGWFSDVYLHEQAFTEDLRENHAVTHQ